MSSHDNFLQKQDTELGWIRNVMRVAGMGSNIVPNMDPDDLDFVVEEWVGNEQGKGQLGYYRKKIDGFKERKQQMEWLGRFVSITVAGVLLAAVAVTSNDTRATLFVILGSLLLFLSVRESFLFKVAEKELIKQYEFMHSIFHNAHWRIVAAESNSDRRKILRVLGESALDEHAQWVFLHRDRTMEAGSLLRLE